jgi:hypothetical protein
VHGFIAVNGACVRLEAKIVLPPTSKPDSKVNIGAVVGGVVGGIVYVAAVVFVVILAKRGKLGLKSKRSKVHIAPQPYGSPLAEGNHAAAIPYTRKVTITWCLFFIANGSIATFTALYSSMEIWSLYNGFIAYILMGSVFVIEYLIRIRVRKQHQ